MTEHLAKDLELFAHHAGRKLVNTEDVILAGIPYKFKVNAVVDIWGLQNDWYLSPQYIYITLC